MKNENSSEYDVCKSIATYLKLQYPSVMYQFDLTGLGLSKAQAGMNKFIQKERGYPDLNIMEARGGYLGLFIEVKNDPIWKSNGELRSAKRKVKDKSGRVVGEYDHLQEQATYLDRLNKKGYMAVFGVGFDEIKEIIDAYMMLPASHITQLNKSIRWQA